VIYYRRVFNHRLLSAVIEMLLCIRTTLLVAAVTSTAVVILISIKSQWLQISYTEVIKTNFYCRTPDQGCQMVYLKKYKFG
jgi:hypothetical protein